MLSQTSSAGPLLLCLLVLGGFVAGIGAMAFWRISRKVASATEAESPEAGFERLIETLPAGILIFDRHQVQRRCNLLATRIFDDHGIACQLGQSLHDLLLAIAGSGMVAKAVASPATWIEEQLKAFGRTDIRDEVRTLSGRWLRIEQRSLPDGAVAYILTDISEERRRQHEFRQQEELFQELATLTTDWFWQTDTEHRFCAQLGPEFDQAQYPFPAIMGRTRAEIAVAEDVARNSEKWAAHEAVLAAHQPFDGFEYEFPSTSGARQQLCVSGRPYFDEDGRFIGYRGVARNMTEKFAEQRRADEAHRRMTETLEAVPMAVALFDAGDRLVYTNQGYRDLMTPFGKAAEAASTREDLFNALRASGMLLTRRQDGSEGTVRPLLPGLTDAPSPFEIDLADGRCLVVNGRRLDDGSLIMTMSDITTFKRQTWQLAEKSTVLQGILDNIEQGLVVFGPDSRLVAWNGQFLKLFGAKQVPLAVGQPMRAVLLALSGAGFDLSSRFGADIDNYCLRVMACDPPQWTVPSPTGRTLDLRRTRMPDGGVAVTCTDITDLKVREQLLEQKSAELEVVIDSLDQGIIVLDGELRIVSLNERMLQYYGMSSDAVYGHGRIKLADVMRQLVRNGNFGDVPREEDIDALVRERMAKWEKRTPFSYERTMTNGTILEIKGNPVQGGGWVTVCRDITQQRSDEHALREAKEQAELASRAKTEFLANTSHELRTPLNAIIGFSEILMSQMFGPLGAPKYLEYVTDVHDSGQHLLDLINDLLDLAKVESGRLELSEEVCSIEKLFASTLRLIRERADAGGIRLICEFDDEPPSVYADQRAIKQILLNLLSNAVKFTPAGGTVTLSANPTADGDLALSVSDTGIGMVQEDIPKALAPFGQIDGSMARRYHGTGLGLPLAQRLAEQHGGQLLIESQKGLGTTVTVLLPASRRIRSEDWPIGAQREKAQAAASVSDRETAAAASR